MPRITYNKYLIIINVRNNKAFILLSVVKSIGHSFNPSTTNINSSHFQSSNITTTNSLTYFHSVHLEEGYVVDLRSSYASSLIYITILLYTMVYIITYI